MGFRHLSHMLSHYAQLSSSIHARLYLVGHSSIHAYLNNGSQVCVSIECPSETVHVLITDSFDLLDDMYFK